MIRAWRTGSGGSGVRERGAGVVCAGPAREYGKQAFVIDKPDDVRIVGGRADGKIDPACGVQKKKDGVRIQYEPVTGGENDGELRLLEFLK